MTAASWVWSMTLTKLSPAPSGISWSLTLPSATPRSRCMTVRPPVSRLVVSTVEALWLRCQVCFSGRAIVTEGASPSIGRNSRVRAAGDHQAPSVPFHQVAFSAFRVVPVAYSVYSTERPSSRWRKPCSPATNTSSTRGWKRDGASMTASACAAAGAAAAVPGRAATDTSPAETASAQTAATVGRRRACWAKEIPPGMRCGPSNAGRWGPRPESALRGPRRPGEDGGPRGPGSPGPVNSGFAHA
ncbi:hypothetical protein ACW23B_16075 [Streptomyces albidoflavus]